MAGMKEALQALVQAAQAAQQSAQQSANVVQHLQEQRTVNENKLVEKPSNLNAAAIDDELRLKRGSKETFVNCLSVVRRRAQEGGSRKE